MWIYVTQAIYIKVPADAWKTFEIMNVRDNEISIVSYVFNQKFWDSN